MLIDLLPLLYYLPNLIECNAFVDHRGREISNDLTLLAPLPSLKRFKYEGLMPPIYLRRLILEINEHIEQLFIYTQDFQWPFHSSEAFSSDLFDLLHDLQTFCFYIRLMISVESYDVSTYFTDTKHLLNRNLCSNIACAMSKDVRQIFSMPYGFKHLEIFEQNIFNQIKFAKYDNDHIRENYWNNIEHLTLHTNIYDLLLLRLIKEKFTKLRSLDYQVPHFSLNPKENELHEYNIQLGEFNIIMYDSV